MKFQFSNQTKQKALDNILVDIANITCGVSLSDLDNAWQCVHSLSDASPFAVSGGNPPIMLFTLGFLVKHEVARYK